MTSKEKVYTALGFKEPSRVPRYVWYSGGAIKNLEVYTGLNGDALEDFLGNDIKQTWVSINREMERDVPDGTEFTDEWGITWKREEPHNMVIRHPLKGASVEELAEYPFPDPENPVRFSVLEDIIRKYGNEYFIGTDVSGSIWEPSYHLAGMDELLMSLGLEDRRAETLFDRTARFTLMVARKALERNTDWIWLGDDVGTQTGMLMSPEMWRKHLKPRLAHIIRELKSFRKNCIIAYHSCGSIPQIIEDLVEIGVNVLNPIQPKAAGMDIYKIKTEYSGVLALMGNIDTQEFLKTASPGAVREETRRMAEELGRGGGYIFAASHSIQPDVPPENIVAMVETLNGSL
ncbi:MAG: uroporphyrinogen decarboxylase family protein [Spirochaetia bacterium]